jgi:phage terminase small subunit
VALKGKQKKFVDEYCIDFNATQAAIRAGYSEKSAGNIGYENVKKPDISEAIHRRLQESAMSADEALMRLADMARGDMADFVTGGDDGPIPDLGTALEDGRLHLVKKLKRKTKTYMMGRGPEATLVTEAEIDFELYDAKAALDTILKAHGVLDSQRGGKDDPLYIVPLSADSLVQASRKAGDLEAELLGDAGLTAGHPTGSGHDG